MVAGRADARPGWCMRMARTAPDCGQIAAGAATSLSRVVKRTCAADLGQNHSASAERDILHRACH